jgi:hypothetical protein
LLHAPCGSTGSQTRTVVPSNGANGVTSLSGPPSARILSAVSHTADVRAFSAPGATSILRRSYNDSDVIRPNDRVCALL